MTRPITVVPVLGVPEVMAGDDLAALLLAGVARSVKGGLTAGDVLVVSSKVVSKSLGLKAVGDDKSGVVAAETVRVVAERHAGDRVTRVVESAAGPVMAAAGVDASNTGPSGELLLLPRNPDGCARELLAALRAGAGMPSAAPLAVVLSDTAGRPWRAGLTDFALGAAGLRVLLDHRGTTDADGRVLSVTARAVADEVAAAADLVKGKSDGVAAAVVRGLPEDWFTPGDPSNPGDLGDPSNPGDPGEFPSGARSLVRTGPGDWFALGHVEALRAALGIDPGSSDSHAVGIRSVTPEPWPTRVGRVVALTLFADEDASADVQTTADSATVMLGATDPFGLGRLATRLEVAAASEDLAVTTWGIPTGEHTVTATLVPRDA
ncbi:coenzyme F420-0:L-glutamate ligase/coenzyme F420-1:gamma-L-glutamate ligase [Knoellia remsis]|uniref:Coenzyme F420-0:L-glutamate ligase/coenzyme F420-1:gamma-L-glutamate ligase n=1 Tax=Knoellia remsis TaxID=407159 RepID=A0A2T0UD30_9MICO|nr:coenzyme F420-0:L-glutamate ligase [Knoellia remsis]PRY55846.1 coenzyme F420-0:L-glutamate ligase/coenzyme F420-1:gamma-L-glutamate ligase [Knoellia remsis]